MDIKPKWIIFAIGLILVLNVAVSIVVHVIFSVKEVDPVISDKGDVNIGDDISHLINPSNIRRHLHAITKKAHPSGTPNNLEVAQYIRDQLISQGLQNVHFNEYDVLLSYPDWKTPNTMEILSESGETVYKTSGRSPAIVKDEQTDRDAELQWFAYSGDGVVEGDVVYVNGASDKDFEHLKELGIELEGKIFLARQTGVFRGNIAQRAIQNGAKGCLFYSDPQLVASLGTGPNQTYQNTDKMPPNAVQRGTLLLGFGDPRTPAFPSIKGLYKEKDEEELVEEGRLPSIPMLPIPYNEAQRIFENMLGEEVIGEFKGLLDVTYRYGPGLIRNQKIRMTVHAKNEERTIRNVLGYIEGREEADKLVIIGNHYDAWTYGAIDPNSGTSALLEVSRALMAYQNETGWVPARSLLFAHWDTEEYGFMGSSEFAEEFRTQLMSRAVAVINMDLIGGNQTLHAAATPSIVNVLREVAGDVRHPNEQEQAKGRRTMLDSWKQFSTVKKNNRTTSYCSMPAGGSDQTAFFDYLGVPVIFFMTSSLDAPITYPLYHTIYETPYLTEKIMDPEFKMHASITEMFIKLILKFSEADILPYDLREFIDDVKYDYLPELTESFERALGNKKYLGAGLEQFEFMKNVVEELSVQIHQRNITELKELPLVKRIPENQRLVEFEKCFINPRGAPGTPEARHVLFHTSSKDTYKGGVMHQVHDLISRISSESDEKKLKKYSKQLARHISLVNYSFICAKHSLSKFLVTS